MTDAAPSWREQAVARSLGSARTRAEHRVQRFVEAATALVDERGDRDFTVQEVVERSGQSLRSFYQHFDGKNGLLLAVFEESVRSTAAHLESHVAGVEGPLERLRALVVEYHRLCRPVGDRTAGTADDVPGPVMVAFVQQLLTTDPAEAARVFSSLVALFVGLLDDAVAAGAVRADIERRAVAGNVLGLVMFQAFAATIGGVPRADDATEAEAVWRLVLHGISQPGPSS